MNPSQRHVLQRGVAGGTLLAFLLVQLCWTPSVSADDALRPTTEGKVAAGLEEASQDAIRAAARSTEWVGPSALGLDTEILGSRMAIRDAVRHVARRILEQGSLGIEFLGPAHGIPLEVGGIFVEDVGQSSYVSPGDLIGQRWLPTIYVGIWNDQQGRPFHTFMAIVGTSNADQAARGWLGGPRSFHRDGQFR